MLLWLLCCIYIQHSIQNKRHQIVNVTKKGSAYFLYDKLILTYQTDFSFVFYTPLYLKKDYIDIGEFKDFALFDEVLIDDQLKINLRLWVDS